MTREDSQDRLSQALEFIQAQRELHVSSDVAKDHQRYRAVKMKIPFKYED
jgi:hypothetical protein